MSRSSWGHNNLQSQWKQLPTSVGDKSVVPYIIEII